MKTWRDAALEIAKRQRRVRVMELAAELGVGMRAARGLISELVIEKLVGPEDASGWHYFLEKPSDNAEKRDQDFARGKTLSLTEQIAELEAQVSRLKEAGKIVIAQREEYKARLNDLEKRHVTSRYGAPDQRFSDLKRLLARELHPDQSPSAGLDRMLREAIFKRLWPLVEEIEQKRR